MKKISPKITLHFEEQEDLQNLVLNTKLKVKKQKHIQIIKKNKNLDSSTKLF